MGLMAPMGVGRGEKVAWEVERGRDVERGREAERPGRRHKQQLLCLLRLLAVQRRMKRKQLPPTPQALRLLLRSSVLPLEGGKWKGLLLLSPALLRPWAGMVREQRLGVLLPICLGVLLAICLRVLLLMRRQRRRLGGWLGGQTSRNGHGGTQVILLLMLPINVIVNIQVP